MYSDVIPQTIDQATILEPVYFYGIDEPHPGVVLTPTCDLEQRKADLIQICALFDAWELIAELVRSDWKGIGLVDAAGTRVRGPLSTGKRREFSSQVKQLIGQRFPRYHWLAPVPGRTGNPMLADFQVLTSISMEDLRDARILAGLSSPFAEQLASRYAAYMGRIGTPDFESAQVGAWIQAAVDTLFPPP